MKADIDYSEYWERCWNEEDAEALEKWLEGWNHAGSEEIEYFKAQGVRTICDAACGFGAHTLAFASNGFDVAAFDVSPKAVELTRAGLARYGYGDVSVQVASITNIGYDDETFDAATAYAVFDHLTEDDAKRALAEMLRIVKPGGFLLLSLDAPEEDDFLCPHELLADGSMVYGSESEREGMIFRPFDDAKVLTLTAGHSVTRKWRSCKGDLIVLLQK